MSCNTGWITRPGRETVINGIKVYYKAADNLKAELYVYVPWLNGGSIHVILPFGATILPNEYRNHDDSSESVVMGYIAKMKSTGSNTLAIQIRLCYNSSTKTGNTPYIPDIPNIPDNSIPKAAKASILSVRMDRGMMYGVNTKIDYHVSVDNVGGNGVIKIWVGVGYTNELDNKIYFTGSPVKNQIVLNRGFSEMFVDSVNLKMSDYNAQRGIGWAYKPMPMKLFFLAGHEENGQTVWDTDRNLNIVITEPPDYKDPTKLGNVIHDDLDVIGTTISGTVDDIIGSDEPDEPTDIGPGFGFGKVTFKMPSILKEIIKRII